MTADRLRNESFHTIADCVFSCASRWLRECLECHLGCQEKKEHEKLPRRLLYLGELDEPNFQGIRLVHTRGRALKYCALSYCWGTEADNFGLTTSENLFARGKGLDAGNLPETIRDAVTICKFLKLSYLWVDSLCIVQDNAEDWRLEASIMNHIYGNALITLIGVSSQNANEGLLYSRWCANRGFLYPSEPENILKHPSKLVDDPWIDVDERTSQVLQARIFTRAWTLQEECMSPRILFWTSNGLVWSCQTRFRREWAGDEAFDPLAKDKDSHLSETYHSQFLSRRHLTFVSMQASPETARKAWMDALRSYLPRQISRSEDRLAAIGGLAIIIQRQVQDDYIAGLWRRTLPEDLLWGIRSHQSSGPSKLYHVRAKAPSWSWGSLSVHCTADAWLGYKFSNTAKVACTLKDLKIYPPDRSIFGPVYSGQLRLLAPRRPFLDPAVHEGDKWLGLTFNGADCYIAVDLDMRQSDVDWDTVECMKILELCGRTFCLLVQPVDDTHETNAFRRLGRAEIFSSKPAIRKAPLLFVPEKSALSWVENDAELYADENRVAYFANCENCITVLI